jgi:hypothetical protein
MILAQAGTWPNSINRSANDGRHDPLHTRSGGQQHLVNLPTSVVITSIDKPEILQQAFEAAKTFKPMSSEQA